MGLKGGRGEVVAGCRGCSLKPQVEGGERGRRWLVVEVVASNRGLKGGEGGKVVAGCLCCNLKPQVEGGKGLASNRRLMWGKGGGIVGGCRSCSLKPRVEGGGRGGKGGRWWLVVEVVASNRRLKGGKREGGAPQTAR